MAAKAASVEDALCTALKNKSSLSFLGIKNFHPALVRGAENDNRK